MTAFQFDECCSWPSYIKGCNKEGLSRAHKFSKTLKAKLGGTKDPEMLAFYMKKDTVLITTDKALPNEHPEHIPAVNPGIIVFEHSEKLLNTVTIKSITGIAKAFKELFPQWHTVKWSNSIVRISDDCIQGGRKTDAGGVVVEFYRKLTDNGWQADLHAYLDANATRS